MSDHPVQNLFYSIMKGYELERAKIYSLGAFIIDLQKEDQDKEIVFDGAPSAYPYPGDFDSYRGYYSDLMLSFSDATCTVGDVLVKCDAANGATYQGYKGGDYTMGLATPLFAADYGCCGRQIVGLEGGDKITILTKKEDV